MKVVEYLLILCCILSFSEMHAQHRLTNRAIYNFEVGDIIHSTYEDFGNHPPNYHVRTIINKWMSVNSDSVFYEVVDSSYVLNASTMKWVLQVKDNIISYTDLDSFPSNRIDSVYFGNCGTTVNTYSYTIPDTIIFEGIHYTYRFYEGVGVEFQIINDDGPHFVSRYFPYYKKSGKDCGNSYQPHVGINAKRIDLLIKIYPNPATEKLHIKLTEPKGNYRVQIFDATGKKFTNSSIGPGEEVVDISALPKGIYFVRVTDEKGNFYSQKIMKM